jgi:hypothetical protein
MATTPDDDEIRLPVPGCGNDFLGGVTERRLGRDRRRAFRSSRSARPVEHVLGRREGEFGCGYLDMLHPRIFLEGGIDPWGEMRDDRQQDELDIAFVRQISGKSDCLARG